MKVVFVGDANVGKTALFTKFLTNETLNETEATIGVEFQRCKITLQESKQEVPLVVWDTAGQEKFQSVTTHHYRGTHAALLCYDITAPNSLRNLRKWMNEVREHAVEGCVCVILANKCDRPDQLMLIDGGKQFARENGCRFFEASSIWDNKYKADGKTGIGAIIETVCEQVLLKQGTIVDKQVLSLSEDVSCNRELLNSCSC